MYKDLLAALALVLIVEGILPFIRPARWKNMMSMMIVQTDSTLRTFGLFSMLAGVLLLYTVR